MGKEKPGFLTPKAIANRIKSKGMQKLRWYCQMCEKQCRDENGFKCHTTSESHQRQLLLFADNSKKFMDDFSGTFNREYINTLKRRFGTKRVNANIVYQEYISEKDHIHMNSTKWLTLSDYVQNLGRQGICVVDQTEKGWFVTYIDRDPETMRRQEEIQKKNKLETDDRERQKRFLEKQMARAKELGDAPKHEATDLIRTDGDEVVKMSFMKTIPKLNSEQNESEKKFKMPEIPVIKEEKNALKEDIKSEPNTSSSVTSCSKSEGKRKHSALDDILKMEEKSREKQNRRDYWLHKNIVIKIVTKKLGEKYHKKKAVVTDVVDKYTGVVRLVETDAVIKLDQAHMETVLPAIGKQVLVLNGAYRGEVADLDKINIDDFNAELTIKTGNFKGKIIKNIQYEDISKLYKD